MASGPYDRSYYVRLSKSHLYFKIIPLIFQNRTGRFGFVYRLVNSDEEDMEEVAQEAVAAADDDDEGAYCNKIYPPISLSACTVKSTFLS